MTNDTTAKLHPFAKAGMGRGPWRFVGIAEIPSASLAEANPEAYNNAIRDLPQCGCGTCACCGAAIMNNYIVHDADGTLFPVGCECIEKISSDGVTDKKLISEARQARKSREKSKRDARNAAKDAEVKSQLDGLRHDDAFISMLQSREHPLTSTRTMLDWFNNMMEWCGRSGRSRLLKQCLAIKAGADARDWTC